MTERCRAKGCAFSGAKAAAAAAVLWLAGPAPLQAAGENGAVVFMYHRFGESGHPSTNITLDQFERHLAELISGRYHLMAVPDIVAAIRAGRDLPDRAIGITIDDAYESVYTEAWPRLRRAGLPFTVFVSTEPVDKGLDGFMSWSEVRELANAGVTIGNHTVSHLHMPHFDSRRNAAELRISTERFREELGRSPALFAFPYGEASAALKDMVKEAGFTAAFGQHSGVIYSGVDELYLPRFALNERYGSMDRFRLAANALPLKVKEITPREVLLSPDTNPPRFGFTVFGEALSELAALACYASGQGKTRLVRLGEHRIETRLDRPFPPGRARINCTMPTRYGRWRWFGMQFVVPRG